MWGVTLAWSAAMLGLGAATAGLTAVIADRVPERQRGMISSAIYGPQALGILHQMGFTVQAPARRAAERDEDAVTGWIKETWPRVERR